MYVADVTDLDELQELLNEALTWLANDPQNEQAKWDQEDILDRIEELNGN